jgi:hypothetical protein
MSAACHTWLEFARRGFFGVQAAAPLVTRSPLRRHAAQHLLELPLQELELGDLCLYRGQLGADEREQLRTHARARPVVQRRGQGLEML